MLHLSFLCLMFNLIDGGWIKANPLPGDKESYGRFEDIGVQNRVGTALSIYGLGMVFDVSLRE